MATTCLRRAVYQAWPGGAATPGGSVVPKSPQEPGKGGEARDREPPCQGGAATQESQLARGGKVGLEMNWLLWLPFCLVHFTSDQAVTGV